MEDKYRHSIYFSTSDDKQIFSHEFLNKCGRKQSIMLALILNEFAEKYNLRDADEEEISFFIKRYSQNKPLNIIRNEVIEPQNNNIESLTDLGKVQDEKIDEEEARKVREALSVFSF